MPDVNERVPVIIELFGVPRMRAGRSQCAVRAADVADAIAELERACPDLSGNVIVDGRLLPSYRLSLNGRVFISDPTRRLAAGDSLVLVAADAGG